MANLCIVGLGGIGSRIASALGLTHNLVLIDPDTYEPQNSHRQPLALMYPNALKAEAISNFISSFTSLADSPTPTTQILPTPLTQLTPLPLLDLIICATDTNTGRLAARHHAHDQSIPLIIAANEQYDGEAYIYLPQWQNTPLDPWTIWPALNEPDAPNTAIHCTDPRIATQAPQTPIANAFAAAAATWLSEMLLAKHSEIGRWDPIWVHFTSSGIRCKRPGDIIPDYDATTHP